MKAYFDNAATTPMRDEVISAMHTAMKSCFGNPSSTHQYGREAKSYIELARKEIATLLGAHPSEIVFTSGGTESDNTVLRTAVNDLGIKTIISSTIEHHAILHTLDALKKEGIAIAYVNLKPDSQIDYAHLENLLVDAKGPTLVSLMHVNNEIGTILDLERVGHLCHHHRALFHTDAVQGVGHFEFDLSQLPVDFLSAAAHKFHGPKGVGFSFIRQGTGLHPFIVGGAQERGMRAGTEAVHSIVGMHTALQLAYANLEEEHHYILGLKKAFMSGIQKIFPAALFNGLCADTAKSTYTLVNVALPISEKQKMLLDFQLDLKDVACSKGSACQSGSSKGSHVLHALNVDFDKTVSLRFSFSKFNTMEEVEYVLSVLSDFAKTDQ